MTMSYVMRAHGRVRLNSPLRWSRGSNRVTSSAETGRDQRARRVIPLIFVLILTFFLSDVVPSAGQDTGSDAAVRSCSGSEPETAATPKPQKRKKRDTAVQKNPYVPACLEIRTSPLDVQERLQQFVRRQNWAVVDEEINETLWSFSLPLTREELLRYGSPPAGTDRVTWDRGKTIVLVKTVALSNGYSRTTIAAQFRGFGESDDKFATQRSFWEWSSSGKLEASLTEELRTRFGGSH